MRAVRPGASGSVSGRGEDGKVDGAYSNIIHGHKGVGGENAIT